MSVAAFPQDLRRLGAVLAAIVGLAFAGADTAVLCATAAVLAVALSDQAGPLLRGFAGLGAVVSGMIAARTTSADPQIAELARIVAATALIVGSGRLAALAAFRAPRSGWWLGTAGGALVAAGAAIAIALAGARGWSAQSILVAVVLAASGARLLVRAASLPRRANVEVWITGGLGLAAAVGIVVGSVDLPRLGSSTAAVPLVSSLMMLLAAGAVHAVSLQRMRRAAVCGALLLVGAIACLLLAALQPELVPAGQLRELAGRTVLVGPAIVIPVPMAYVLLAIASLMLLTLADSKRRFGWMVGWVCGMALLMVGLLGVSGWLLHFDARLASDSMPLTAMGSLAMVSLGVGITRLASVALREQRVKAIWMPSLAAAIILAATVFTWQQAELQARTLRQETAMLALERASRAVRETVARRVEALSRLGSVLRTTPASERQARLPAEADVFLRDNPGAVAIHLAGPDHRARYVVHAERAGSTRPGDDLAWEAQRLAVYQAAFESNRPTLSPPLELSGNRGPGFLIVVPVELDGERWFLGSSQRFGMMLQEPLETATSGFDVDIATGGRSVLRFRPTPGSQPEANEFSTTLTILQTTWNVGVAYSPEAVANASMLPRTILLAGLALAALLASALRLAALARERADAADRDRQTAERAAAAQLAAQRALADSQAGAARVLDSMSDAVFTLDARLRLTFLNAKARELLGQSGTSANGSPMPEQLLMFSGTELEVACHAALADGVPQSYSGYSPALGLWLAGRIYVTGGGLTLFMQDVTDSRRGELFEREQREVLQGIATGESLQQTLLRTVALYEDLHPWAIASVVLHDPATGTMRTAAAPRLPPEYCAEIDGVAIGEGLGSCGTALHRGERVVVVDIAIDPLWANFRDLASRHQLGSCWSQPFMSRNGEPLGSLAIYHRDPRTPSTREIAALETLAAICAIAVERAQAVRRLEDSEQRLRSLFDNQPDAVFAMDRDGVVTAVNQSVLAISGYPQDAIIGQPYDGLIDEHCRAEVRRHFERAREGEPTRYSTIGVRVDGQRRQVDVTNLPIVVDGAIVGVYGVARDVTEQRATEARLLERDRFFSLSPLAFAISDAVGKFTQVNDAFPRMLGYTREQMLGGRVLDFIVEDDIDASLAAIHNLAAGGTVNAFTNRYRCADGSARWLQWNALRSEQGSIFASARDVTAQVQAAESEALMRRVLEGSPAVLWRWLPEAGWPVGFVTDNVAQWGYAPEDFSARRLVYADLIHPEDMPALLVALGATEENGSDHFEHVYRIRRADGAWVWVDERTAIVRHVDGRVSYWQGVTLDVTAREQGRQAMLERDQFFEMSPDLFAISSGNGYFSQVNRAFTSLLGYSVEEMLARPMVDFILPDDRDFAAAARRTLDEAGAVDTVALRYVCKDASVRMILWNALRTDASGIVISGRDITEERRAQEQERLLMRIIEDSPAVMWRWSPDPGSSLQLVSDNVRQWGYNPGDFTSGRMAFDDLVHPQDIERALATTVAAADPAVDRVRATYRVRAADGRWLWIDERTTIVRDPDGNALYLQGITLDITEAQRAREEERRLLGAIETGPAVLWRFNPYATPSTQLVTANVSRWGYRPADFTSGRLRFTDLVHPDDRDAILSESMRRIEAGAGTIVREFRLRTADGRWVWVTDHVQVVYATDGSLDFCLALSFDITQERVARDNERQLHRVIALSPAVLWRFDPAKDIPTQLVSSNVIQWGYTEEDFTSGRVLLDALIHPDDHGRVLQHTRSAIAAGAREIEVVFRFRAADGRWVWLDARVTVVRDSFGAMVDCVSLTLDVTEQRSAMASMHERDQFYALSLEIFAVADRSGRFRQVNEALTRVLGYPVASLVGERLIDYVHPDDLDLARDQMRILGVGGRLDMVELRCRTIDGDWRWLEWNAAPGPDDLYYCAARDVTEHKRLAAELRRAMHELERRNSELQDFAFVASHDLQEPLRKVQAFSDRVIARYADRLDAQGIDYLQRMDAASRRMQTLIDDLLAYSRVSTRGESFRVVDLARVLREVIGDLEARLESSGGEIVVGSMPSLQADPTQMRQLLQNLLGNALKFAMPGRTPRVEVSALPIEMDTGAAGRRDGWRLQVVDNGIGFEADHAERIFAPFHRLHGRSEYEGTGMGLAIVRKIVERHAGVVRASGSTRRGATFTVDLPSEQSQAVHKPREHDQILANGAG